MGIRKLMENKVLLFDGGMGTMLQKRGLPVGALPELYNITHPQIVADIHREYVEAGADVITANTFQCNRLKLPKEYEVEKLIWTGVKNARDGGAKYVALDVGPLGQLMEPLGTLSFQQAYALFREQVVAGEQAGADCIVIETVSDPLEAKAAILAARENTKLPVFCTMTFQEDGRTFVGCDPISATFTLQGLGLDAFGLNCSLGPAELVPIAKEILKYARVPVMVQANAGLPEMAGEQTVYTIGAKEFAAHTMKMVEAGVRIVGGCCGTTPDFIRELSHQLKGFKPREISPTRVSAVSSGTKTVFLDGNVAVIGERINPTGKKKLKEALRNNQLDYIATEAIDQTQAGADILDINVGLPEIDEPLMMQAAVREVQAVSSLPLQIDSSDVAAVEAGIRVCAGRPLVNSVNGKLENMEEIFPVVKKYGAMVVGLTLDEAGIPETAEGRLAIATRIVKKAAEYGIPPEDILIDCLVLTASAQQEQVRETLRAIPMVKEKLGVKTVLGVSNVSFGLPNRELLNATFLAAAFGAGLDAPILNPLSSRYMEVVDTFRVLNAEDKNAERFLHKHGAARTAVVAAATSELDLKEIIIQGRKAAAKPKVEEMLKNIKPLEIIDAYFVPALNTVGKRFETGELFLPQLMRSAEAVQAGFAAIQSHMDALGEKRESKGKILMATVRGDIHDIGKNIVCMLLRNYGYEVFDLGKDVSEEQLIQTVQEHNITLVGLSALMTTTVKNMKESISAIRAAGFSGAIMVGGAVLNPEYASFVGADYYAKDAMESVAIAERFFEEGR